MLYIIHKRALEYVNDQIDMVGSQHNCNTRESIMSCSVPLIKRKKEKEELFLFFIYPGISLWNNLPLHIKLNQTKAIFKRVCGRVDGSR